MAPSQKLCEQLAGFDGKGFCQLHYIFQGHVPLAPLHATHVIAMQAGPLGKLLLGVTAFVTEFS